MKPDPVACAIERVANNLFSPNVADSNLEAANIVDVLHQCSLGLFAIAKALRDINQGKELIGNRMRGTSDA